MATFNRQEHYTVPDTFEIGCDRFLDAVYAHAFDCNEAAYYEWLDRWLALGHDAKWQLLGFWSQGMSARSAASMVA